MNFEVRLKKTAAAILASLLSTPYIVFIFISLITGHNFKQVIDAPEIRTLLITLHVLLISLLVTAAILSQPSRSLRCRVNSRQDAFLLVFLCCMITSSMSARCRPSWTEISCWSQAAYLYFMLPFVIDNTARNIRRLLTAMITTGAIIAIGGSVILFHDSIYLPRNPLAIDLMLPLYLACSRLCREENSGKRILYWISLFSILVFLALSKCRAAWLALFFSFPLLYVLEKNIYRQMIRAASRWEKMIIASGVMALIFLSLLYSKKLEAHNLLGLDKVARTFLQFHEGSIYGRFKLWGNSLLLLKDHWLTGVGLGNWETLYPLYSHRLFYDTGFFTRPVNFYLKLAIEVGLPGAAALVIYFGGQLASQSPKTNLIIFIKCALGSLFFTIFFHELFPYFLPVVFIVFLLLSYLRAEAQTITLNKNLLLAVCLLFNFLFGFECVLGYKSAEFSLFESLAGKYYMRPPDLSSPQRNSLYSLENTLANALQSRADDIFLRLTHRPDDINPYFFFAKKEHALKDNAKALDWINQASEISPANFSIVTLKGRLEHMERQGLKEQKTHESYIQLGYPGLWMRKILGDDYKESGHKQEALQQYQLGKKEFDYTFNFAGQDYLYLIKNGFFKRKTLINLADSAKKDLGIKSARDIAETIESTPQYNFSLAYDQKKETLFFSSNLIDGFDLYAAPVKRDLLRQLTKLGDYAPFRLQFSEADQRIYFTSDWQGNYNYNLFYWDIKNKSLKKITDYRNADAGEYELSQDEKKVAYILRDGPQENLYLLKDNFLNAQQLTSDGYPKKYPCWNPNGLQIAYVCHKNGICVYDLPSASSQEIIHNRRNLIKMLSFSRDGRHLLFAQEANEQTGQIYEYDFDTARIKPLTRGAHLKLFPRYVDDRHVIYIEKIMDNYLLRSLDTITGKTVPIGPRQGVVYGVSLLQFSQTLLFFFSDNATPCTVCSLSLKNGSFRKLLKLDDIHRDDIIYPQRIILKAEDSSRIPVYYFQPYHKPADRQYPAIIWLHGGHEEFSPRWQMYTQYFAVNGFAVFALNYRPDNANDIFRLCDYIRQNSSLRVSGIYLVGVSMGAAVIEKALQTQPGLFRGAVEMAGVVNPSFDAPIPGLPPMKFFFGKNDVWVSRDKKMRQIAAQKRHGSRIEWTILDKEGHDFRHQNNIQKTLEETVSFFKKIEDNNKLR